MLEEEQWKAKCVVFSGLACHRVMQCGQHVKIQQIWPWQFLGHLPSQESATMLLLRKLFMNILLVREGVHLLDRTVGQLTLLNHGIS